jgi:Reverse transcriptase (RNA-dependent DNA polymerase)
VCLLHKSLYSLKQATKAWFQKLSDCLVHFDFKLSCYDPSLFLSHSQGHTTLILVYVDDIIVTVSNSDQVQNYINQLGNQFIIRDLDNLHYFLGIKATTTKAGLYLSQTKYFSDLLK